MGVGVVAGVVGAVSVTATMISLMCLCSCTYVLTQMEIRYEARVQN